MRYIFFTFSYIFFSVKKVCSSKKIFQQNFFFHIKTFFSAKNVYFVKSKNISQKKLLFLNLVLQQMNNHTFDNPASTINVLIKCKPVI